MRSPRSSSYRGPCCLMGPVREQRVVSRALLSACRGIERSVRGGEVTRSKLLSWSLLPAGTSSRAGWRASRVDVRVSRHRAVPFVAVKSRRGSCYRGPRCPRGPVREQDVVGRALLFVYRGLERSGVAAKSRGVRCYRDPCCPRGRVREPGVVSRALLSSSSSIERSRP